MKLKIISGRWEKKFHKYLIIGSGILLVSIFIGLVCYTLAMDQVTLTVDGRVFKWKTLSPTVAKVLKEKKVSLRHGDQVQPSLTTAVKENMKIQVIRAFRVKIVTAGATSDFYTVALPVRRVLTEARIKFDADDIIKPELDSIVKPEQKIKVINVRTEVVTKKVVLNPQTEYKSDKKLERGVSKIIRNGQPGLAVQQIKITYHDGNVAQRQTLSQKTLKPVVNTIMVVGTKPAPKTLVTSRGSYRYLEMKVMDATAYYPGPESCGKYAAYGVTYTGKKAGFGVVAVDPRVIPLGTMLYVEGYGKAEAADIGGAIKGNRIDLCYETYREAWMFGRKKVKVYILE